MTALGHIGGCTNTAWLQILILLRQTAQRHVVIMRSGLTRVCILFCEYTEQVKTLCPSEVGHCRANFKWLTSEKQK